MKDKSPAPKVSFIRSLLVSLCKINVHAVAPRIVIILTWILVIPAHPHDALASALMRNYESTKPYQTPYVCVTLACLKLLTLDLQSSTSSSSVYNAGVFGFPGQTLLYAHREKV